MNPRSYGRVVRGEDGGVVAIVEAADATPEQLAINEVNSSIYVFRGDALWPALEQLTAHNAQGELYLTDAVRAVADGGATVARLRRPRSGGDRGRQHARRARRGDRRPP